MGNDLISVIMSVFNTEEPALRDSIESICGQTYDNIEFIIVLDKPTDGSAEIVKEYCAKDSRIKLIENEVNIGLTKSLNKALAAASGKYIARMDSDDVAFRHRLEKQYRYMEEHPEVVALGTQVCTSLDPAHALDVYPLCDWMPDQEAMRIRMMFYNVGISHPTALLRHDVMLKNGVTYDERIKKSQDYKLWVDLMPYGTIWLYNEMLLMYRIHPGQISNNRSSQKTYVDMVAIEQAEKLLGTLTDEEKEFHKCVSTIDIYNNDVKGYGRYMQKMRSAKAGSNRYDVRKFKREIAYLWLRKAFRRAVKLHKFDMLFSSYVFKLGCLSAVPYFFENKQVKKMRQDALKTADFTDCKMR